MDDVAVGRALRAVRVRRRLRQVDVARLAGVSQQTVSRVETGRIGEATITTLRSVATAVGARVIVDVRWQGAELDRLLGARHSAMHEALAGMFAGLPGWAAEPEVSFAVYGERGVIDILAWHPSSRSLLVIEIKTELVDVQETIGVLDRKIRLAPTIAKERGWGAPASVSAWLVIAEGSTNRDRVDAHRIMLRASLPADGMAMRAWLGAPVGRIRALSFLASVGPTRSFAPTHRVRPGATPERG